MRESWVPSKITLDKIRNDIGKDGAKLFHNKYRVSRERCNNPNNKDYESYKGKFKFKNLTDFYENCYCYRCFKRHGKRVRQKNRQP